MSESRVYRKVFRTENDEETGSFIMWSSTIGTLHKILGSNQGQ
jgi:hypothetical protein